MAIGHWKWDRGVDNTQVFDTQDFTVDKRYRRTDLEASLLKAYVQWLKATVPSSTWDSSVLFDMALGSRVNFDHHLLQLLLQEDFYVWAVEKEERGGENEGRRTVAALHAHAANGERGANAINADAELGRLKKAVRKAEKQGLTLLAWHEAIVAEGLSASEVWTRHPKLANGKAVDNVWFVLAKDLIGKSTAGRAMNTVLRPFRSRGD